VGLFELLRDVLGDSFDYGQFRSACITIILLFVIWRLSPSGLAQVLIRLIDFAERRSSIGYWMALSSLIACQFHVRYERRMAAMEYGQTMNELKNIREESSRSE
jgi:hypothetical protein